MRLSLTLRDAVTGEALPGYESFEAASAPGCGDRIKGLATEHFRRHFQTKPPTPTHDSWVVSRVVWTIDPRRMIVSPLKSVEYPGNQHADVYLVPDLGIKEQP